MESWYLRCLVRYLPTHLVGWAVAAALASPFIDPSSTDSVTYLPFWESYAKHLCSARVGAPVVAGVSLVLLLLLGAGRTRGSVLGFRAMAAGLLQLPLLPFALAGGGDLVGTLMLSQLAFAILIMPKPQLTAP
ncbi:hypothetical protein [Streptomyces sp. NPDC085540]|uniref:hypothetical protein n=1 Tax=Streptomyces sp. NPDC085540 TaxID=3365730 RepID=UPI0037D4DEE8